MLRQVNATMPRYQLPAEYETTAAVKTDFITLRLHISQPHAAQLFRSREWFQQYITFYMNAYNNSKTVKGFSKYTFNISRF